MSDLTAGGVSRTARRYPIAPLLALTGWTMQQLCRQAPCNGSEYRRRLELGVTERTADRLAVAAGLHPFELWPSMPGDRRRDQWAASARRRYRTDAEHRAARAEYMRRYRTDAAKAIAAQKRQWNAANVERRRASTRAAMRRYRARQRERQEAA